MTTVIKSIDDLKEHIDAACNRAVETTSITVMDRLHDCIDEQYYKDPEFYPNVYKRTNEFFNHVAYDMLSSNTAQIYVDIEGIRYKNNFSPWQVVKWALESKHGADYYQTNTKDFWTAFIEWCNDNLMELLKKNLRKQGLNVK